MRNTNPSTTLRSAQDAKGTAARAAKVELPPEAMDATPRIALTFTDETIFLTRFTLRGEPSVTYPVLSEHVASAFKSFGADTGILAPDTLFWQRRGGMIRIGIWLPPGVRGLTFARSRGAVALRAPMPGFVFVGQGAQYAIFAAKARPTKMSDRLCAAPLTNVHDNGTICAGSVKFPKAASDTIAQAAALFWESHFADHLDGNRIMAQRDDKSLNLFQFLRGLRGKKQFPLAELVPAITMDELLGGEGHG